MSIPGVVSKVHAKLNDRMWVATTDELRVLFKVCRSLETTSREHVRSALVDSESSRRAEYEKRRWNDAQESKDAVWKIENERQLIEYPARIKLSMAVVHRTYGREQTGDPDLVLDEIDRPQEIRSMTIRLGQETDDYYLGATSGFRLVFDKYGVGGRIFGSDPRWIDMARAALLTELRKQRPWYFWMRSSWFMPVALFVPASIFLANFWGLPLLKEGIWIPYIGAMVLAIILTVLFNQFVWPRFVPMFELVGTTKRARGAVVLGSIATAVAWYVAAFVAPYLTR